MALTGRKRFMEDVRDMAEQCKRGFIVRGLSVHGTVPNYERVASLSSPLTRFGLLGFRIGDEEGAFQCEIKQPDGQHLVALTFHISGAYFCCSSESLSIIR